MGGYSPILPAARTSMQSGSYTVTSGGTSYRIPFDSIDISVGNFPVDIDFLTVPTTGDLTIPVTGVYHVSGGAKWTGSAAGTYRRLDFFVNGSYSQEGGQIISPSGVAAPPRHTISCYKYLTKGNILSVYAQHDGGAGIQILAGTMTFLAAVLVDRNRPAAGTH